MLKFLLLVSVLALVWWLLRKKPPARREPPAAQREPEAMVRCAHCGVYLPRSDGVSEGDRYFCCEAHRQAGARTERQ